MGRLGPSGQVVPETGNVVCGNQRLDTCMHAHTNKQLVSKEVEKEGRGFPSGVSTHIGKTFIFYIIKDQRFKIFYLLYINIM